MKHKNINQSEFFISWKGRKRKTLIGTFSYALYVVRYAFALGSVPQLTIKAESIDSCITRNA